MSRLPHILSFIQLALPVLCAPTLWLTPLSLPPAPSTTDHRMLLESQLIQTNRLNTPTLQPVPLTGPLTPILNFESRAWDLARTHGGVHVDIHTPTSNRGRRSVYFYSTIPHSSDLGRELGLEQGQVASVLWKYYPHPPRGKEVVHVGVYKLTQGKWRLDDFEFAIRHTHL